MLDIEKVLTNPDAQIVMAHPTSGTSLIALNETDFGFDISAVYDAKDASSAGQVTQIANAAANAVGMQQMVLKNIRETISQWTGNVKPIFNVPFTIIAYNPTIRPVDIVANLSSLAAVKLLGGQWGALQAPGGYAVQTATTQFGADSVSGTWALQIGRHFRATGLTLLSVGHTLSKETVRGTHQPLYARVNVAFQPAILPDADTVRSWFRV